MGKHRDDTSEFKSLEETVLESIDQAAAAVQEPVQEAFSKIVTLKRVVAAGLVFVVAFAVSMLYALVKVDDIADQNQQYLVEGCEYGNTSRASELGFWLAIFADTADNPEAQTPKAKALRKVYLERLYETYPQLDCSKVKDGKRVVIPSQKVGTK